MDIKWAAPGNMTKQLFCETAKPRKSLAPIFPSTTEYLSMKELSVMLVVRGVKYYRGRREASQI